MKKILLSTLAIAAVAVGCQTEKLEESTVRTGETVKIVAELPDTRTVFNPEDKTVAWEDSDELTVIVNSSSNYKFSKVSGENAFSAPGVTLQDGENTYHVLYPYNSYVKTVDVDGVTCNASGAKTYVDVPSEAAAAQKGIDNTDHVKGVIYGYATAADSETPSVQMHQLTALLKIEVTNNHTEPVEVRSITVSTDAAGQLLSGTYYINLETGETESSGDQYTFNYTVLGVSDAVLNVGAKGAFWVSAHPFSVPQGSKLTISVETDKGISSDERIYGSDLEFAAGTVNTASFNFEAPEAIEKLTVTEFLAKEVGNVYYELTGTISNISNTTYGNFDLTDETGTVYVYGLTATKVTSNDKSFSSLGLKEGDIVTLIGTRAEYNGDPQVGGPAYYVSHETAPYCNVTPGTVTVAADATSATFNVDAKVEWTITSDNPDFKVFPASGSEAAEIAVTFPANETSETVTAVLTVSSELGEKTVTISQASATASTVELLREDFAGLGGNNTESNGANSPWNGNDNFPTQTNAYQAGDAVKLGTGSKTGSIVSKTLTVPAGTTLTVNFDVKGWSKVEGDIEVTFNGETRTVEYTAVMGGSFESKSVSFVVASETSSTVEFATTAKRAYLDNIVISYTK